MISTHHRRSYSLYKIATKCEGREFGNIMDSLMRSWIRYFGPMRVLVSDQERSMMSVDAGSELQRLGITRQPGGTTTKHQGKQHTATGLVEKHVDLTKITMAKIQAEAERWGIEVSGETLAAEASQAQNTVVNIGGYTAPSMCVFCIFPKVFFIPKKKLQWIQVKLLNLRWTRPADFDKLHCQQFKQQSWKAGLPEPTNRGHREHQLRRSLLEQPRWRFSEMMEEDMAGEDLQQS